MLKHLVLLNWKKPLTQIQQHTLEQALTDLPQQIEAIHSYSFGTDLGCYPGNADFALIAEFINEEALRSYVEHPAHQALMHDVIKPCLASYQSIQFTV